MLCLSYHQLKLSLTIYKRLKKRLKNLLGYRLRKRNPAWFALLILKRAVKSRFLDAIRSISSIKIVSNHGWITKRISVLMLHALFAGSRSTVQSLKKKYLLDIRITTLQLNLVKKFRKGMPLIWTWRHLTQLSLSQRKLNMRRLIQENNLIMNQRTHQECPKANKQKNLNKNGILSVSPLIQDNLISVENQAYP